MNVTAKRWLWLILYFVILLAPLIVILIGPRPGPRELWRELSVALGFTGLALVGVQFIPTARLQAFSNVFSMDEVYYFHQRASVIGFTLVLAHPLILFLFNPETVRLLNPFTAPARAVFGLVALLAMIALVITSIYRKELGIRYEIWRLVHATLSVVMILGAMLHMLGVDYYLSLPWQRVLWIGLTVMWLGLIINTHFIRALRKKRQPYKLVEVRQENEATWTLALEPDGHAGLRFMPGQFAWITIERPPFSLRQHPFSFASNAEQPERLEFTIGEAGDFTSTVGQLAVGEVVYIDGPHGTFSIDRYDGPGYVFIAGGIGAPPVMSMLRTMAARGSRKPAWLFYGNPTPEMITYAEELIELEQTLDLQIVHVLEDPPDNWHGETGFINGDILDRHLPKNRNDLICFICGPVPMIDAMLQALDEIRVPLHNVHTEQYEMV